MEPSASSAAATAAALDREGNALGGLFQNIIADLRSGTNNWDDLLLKANKFHAQLKSTISCSTAFLDAFQKIADMATTTRGGTKEIGSALTRLCLRNRSVEAKLKSMTSSMLDSFILPLQDRVDEWKKIIVQIDKEHNKEIKRLKQFRKKHHHSAYHLENGGGSPTFSTNTFRIKRRDLRTKSKSNGGGVGGGGTDFPRAGSIYDMDKLFTMFNDSMENGDAGGGGGAPGNSGSTTGETMTMPSTVTATANNKEKYFMLEEVERNYVRRALLEERGHYCYFFKCLRPFIEEEMSMLQEIIHLEEIVGTLATLTNDPGALPASSETFLTGLQLQQQQKQLSRPPSASDVARLDHRHHQHNHHNLMAYGSEYATSNGSVMSRSRKSSISSMDSFNTLSTDSISIRNCKSLSQPNITPGCFRPKSIASQDSGFLSHYQEYNVSNIGKVVIVKNGKNAHQTKDVCLSAFKANMSAEVITTTVSNDTIKSSSSATVEYAAADQMFINGGDHHHHHQQQQPPIYVNVRDAYPAAAVKPSYYHFSSEGSVTPTNNANVGGPENNQKPEIMIKPKPKPPPPKPPVRHSSILSSKDLPPPPPPPPEVQPKRSTLIYVPDNSCNKENSLPNDAFPAPPPEAFMRPVAEPATNLCCRYSVPNTATTTTTTHLVFCENQECLKDLENSIPPPPPPLMVSRNSHHSSYGGSQNYLSGNPYALFETNVDQTCTPTSATNGWINTAGGNGGGTAICHHQEQPYDRRRFHSTVNLSEH